jgi:hypothetical protein
VVHNVRRAAKLFLLKNVYTLVAVVILVGLLREAFPYLPQQVTLLNSLTIGGPAVLLMLSKAPPHVAERAAFLPEVARFAFGMGVPVALAGVALWHVGDTVEEKRTLFLSFLIPAGLANAVLIAARDRRMFLWAAAAAATYVAAMYVPPVAYVFALTPLTWGQWVGALAAAAGTVAAGWWLVRWWDHFTR